MIESLQGLGVSNGDLVDADHMPDALTAGTLAFSDGATQVFTADGHTTFIEHGRPSHGDWWVVDDGRFGSSWPPGYRATYALTWIVEAGQVVGLTFVEDRNGTRFDGRYLT